MQGERNAIPSRELRKWTGLKTNRDLQIVIAKERAEGKLILSTCRNGGGYFAPSDGALGVSEIRSFIATLNNRAVNTQKALTLMMKKPWFTKCIKSFQSLLPRLNLTGF